jgi:hypothetical protein
MSSSLDHATINIQPDKDPPLSFYKHLSNLKEISLSLTSMRRLSTFSIFDACADISAEIYKEV